MLRVIQGRRGQRRGEDKAAAADGLRLTLLANDDPQILDLDAICQRFLDPHHVRLAAAGGDQQGVDAVGVFAAEEGALQPPELDKEVERRRLFRPQAEAAHAAGRQDVADGQPENLDHLAGVLAAHECLARHFAGSLEGQQDLVSDHGPELVRQRLRDQRRRVDLPRAAAEIDLALEQRSKPVFDPENLHPGGACLGGGVDGAAASDDQRDDGGAPTELGTHLGGQILAHEPTREGGVLDLAKTRQGEVAQTTPHRVAHHQRPGEHRRGHRGTGGNRQMALPVVPQTATQRPSSRV